MLPHQKPSASRGKRQLSPGGRETDNEIQKRRIRNRLSQRSFRERQAAYINELEETTRLASATESERNKLLSEQNLELQKALFNIRKNVLGLSFKFSSISNEIGKLLNLDVDPAPHEKVSPMSEESEDEGSNCSVVPGHMRQAVKAATAEEGKSFSRLKSPTVHEKGRECKVRRSRRRIITKRPRQDNSIDVLAEQSLRRDSSENAQVGLEESLNCVMNENIGQEVSLDSDSFQLQPRNDPTIIKDLVNPEHSMSPIKVTTSQDIQNLVMATATESGICSPSYEQQNTFSAAIQKTKHQFDNDFLLSAINYWESYPLYHLGAFSTSILADPQFLPNHHKSLFLEHVEMLESLVLKRVTSMGGRETPEKLTEMVTTAIDLFYHYAWEETAIIWTSSHARNIVESILLWRCNPNVRTYENLPPTYRPSSLQLSTEHSSIIDWFPYPPLRDCLIIHHNHSDILDELFWDFMSSYVVKVDDIATILTDVGHGPGLIGVWNIIEGMGGSRNLILARPFMFQDSKEKDLVTMTGIASQTSGFDIDDERAIRTDTTFGTENLEGMFTQPPSQTVSIDWTPKPLELILSSKSLSRDLFYHLQMYDSKNRWLFDPALFNKYPELQCDGYEGLVAEGKSFRIPSRKVGPTKMTKSTINIYHKALLAKQF